MLNLIIIAGIMIVLHNLQLQNQCFRPYSHQHTRSNLIPDTHHNCTNVEEVIELRKSSSNADPTPKIDSQNDFKDKGRFQASNWMANHFLGDIKQKFKQIFRQKSLAEDVKKVTSSPRKNSIPNSRNLNLSLNCQSAAISDKKVIFRAQTTQSSKSKRLVDIKRGRLFRSTHREQNDFIQRQFNCEHILSTRFLPHPQEPSEEEELDESYLQSQYARPKVEREEERLKTIEPGSNHFEKYDSNVMFSSLKHHHPIPSENIPSSAFPDQNETNTKEADKLTIKNCFINKRGPLMRQKHYRREFKSKVNLQVNAS